MMSVATRRLGLKPRGKTRDYGVEAAASVLNNRRNKWLKTF